MRFEELGRVRIGPGRVCRGHHGAEVPDLLRLENGRFLAALDVQVAGDLGPVHERPDAIAHLADPSVDQVQRKGSATPLLVARLPPDFTGSDDDVPVVVARLARVDDATLSRQELPVVRDEVEGELREEVFALVGPVLRGKDHLRFGERDRAGHGFGVAPRPIRLCEEAHVEQGERLAGAQLMDGQLCPGFAENGSVPRSGSLARAGARRQRRDDDQIVPHGFPEDVSSCPVVSPPPCRRL